MSIVATFFRALRLDTRLNVKYKDDAWEYTEEPHVHRRQLILQAHPEIKRLMGHDPAICWYVCGTVLAQITLCWVVSWLNPAWLVLVMAAWAIGGTLNHSLGGSIHEIGHNLAFGHKRNWANRVLSLCANLPLGIPMAISYKKYHQDHHRWLGHDERDTDVPTRLEAVLFSNCLSKLVWLVVFPLTHAIRPFLKQPKPVTVWEIVNFVVQLAFDWVILRVFGVKALVYLVAGTILGLGIHPLSGHFISEHYLFSNNQATHSYYGPLNRLIYNLGYHVEHHDFPYIPYTRLPKVSQIAPEFYRHIPYHTSWCKVLWDFIWNARYGPKAHMITLTDMSSPQLYSQIPVVPMKK